MKRDSVTRKEVGHIMDHIMGHIMGSVSYPDGSLLWLASCSWNHIYMVKADPEQAAIKPEPSV